MKYKLILILLIILTISCNKEDDQVKHENLNEISLIHKIQNELISHNYKQKDLFDWEAPIIEYNSNKEPYIVEVETKKNERNKIIKAIFNLNDNKLTSQIWILTFKDENTNTNLLRKLKVHEILLDFSGTITIYDITSKLSKQLSIDNPVNKTAQLNGKYSTRANHLELKSACTLCHNTLNEIVITTPGSGSGGWGNDFGSDFGIGVIPGGGFPGWKPTPDKNIDNKIHNNPCLQAIYKTVMDTNFADTFIKDTFDSKNSEFDLIWMIQNPSTDQILKEYPKTNGYTTAINDNSFKIVLNSDKFKVNPKIVVASTIIHETIHAHLYRIRQQYDPNKNFSTELEMAFPGVFDYVLRYANDGTARAQHEQMAAHYIETVQNALRAYDNTFDSKYYEALAWLGLEGTLSWDRLGKKKQEEIKRNFNELKSKAPKMGC